MNTFIYYARIAAIIFGSFVVCKVIAICINLIPVPSNALQQKIVYLFAVSYYHLVWVATLVIIVKEFENRYILKSMLVGAGMFAVYCLFSTLLSGSQYLFTIIDKFVEIPIVSIGFGYVLYYENKLKKRRSS